MVNESKSSVTPTTHTLSVSFAYYPPPAVRKIKNKRHFLIKNRRIFCCAEEFREPFVGGRKQEVGSAEDQFGPWEVGGEWLADWRVFVFIVFLFK